MEKVAFCMDDIGEATMLAEISWLRDTIGRIPQINSTGIKDQLKRFIDRMQYAVKYDNAFDMYQDLKRVFRGISETCNQTGALMQLDAIMEKYL